VIDTAIIFKAGAGGNDGAAEAGLTPTALVAKPEGDEFGGVFAPAVSDAPGSSPEPTVDEMGPGGGGLPYAVDTALDELVPWSYAFTVCVLPDTASSAPQYGTKA
jgi:hypothetical protein